MRKYLHLNNKKKQLFHYFMLAFVSSPALISFQYVSDLINLTEFIAWLFRPHLPSIFPNIAWPEAFQNWTLIPLKTLYFFPRRMETVSGIPLVDFSAMSVEHEMVSSYSDDQVLEIARQIHQAFSTVGFVYLKNHGISQKMVRKHFLRVQFLQKCDFPEIFYRKW